MKEPRKWRVSSFEGLIRPYNDFSLFWVRDPRVSRLSGLAAGRIWGGLGEVDRLGDHADEHVEGGGGAEEGDGEGAELVDGVELRLFDQTVHFLSPFLVFRLRHSVLASPLKTWLQPACQLALITPVSVFIRFSRFRVKLRGVDAALFAA